MHLRLVSAKGSGELILHLRHGYIASANLVSQISKQESKLLLRRPIKALLKDFNGFLKADICQEEFRL